MNEQTEEKASLATGAQSRDDLVAAAQKQPASLANGLLRALRPHQWTKNILIFLPLLLAHEVSLSDPAKRAKMLACLWAFFSFSLCASASYVLNDLHDLKADRNHPTKRQRPFASGQVPLRLAPPLLAGLLAASACIAVAALPGRFVALLALYFALTLSYSFYFKQKLLLDVMILAGLYTLRIMAGAAACDVPLTPWMLAFSMFFFLSLAFAKRYTEVMRIMASGKTLAEGRSYILQDLNILPIAGLASGYLSVLVLALYISDAIHGGAAPAAPLMPPRVLYPRAYFLWLICPLLLYWVTRLWFHARRGALHDDPVVFAIEDRVSWLAGGLAAGLMLLASLPSSVGWLP